jgi:hypothetical protein
VNEGWTSGALTARGDNCPVRGRRLARSLYPAVLPGRCTSRGDEKTISLLNTVETAD